MPKILFDMEAYSYAQGIKAISLMFEAAKTTLNLQHIEIEQAIAEYERHLERGGVPFDKWEDGHKLYDQEDIYRLEQLSIDDAISELRVATVIAIYHLWERHVPNSSGKNREHKDLIADVSNHSIGLHKDIDALCYCANYLKHGSEKWLKKLENQYPERFPSAKKYAEGWPAAFRKIHLKDTEIEWFIEIALASDRPISNM